RSRDRGVPAAGHRAAAAVPAGRRGGTGQAGAGGAQAARRVRPAGRPATGDLRAERAPDRRQLTEVPLWTVHTGLSTVECHFRTDDGVPSSVPHGSSSSCNQVVRSSSPPAPCPPWPPAIAPRPERPPEPRPERPPPAPIAPPAPAIPPIDGI